MKPTIKVTFVFNNTSWASVADKVKQVVDFYSSVFVIEPLIKFTNFVNIPFVSVSTMDGVKNTPGFTNTVERHWYDQNITSLATNSDVIIFYLPQDGLPPMQTSIGIEQGKYMINSGPIQTCLFGIGENDHTYQYLNEQEVDQGNTFVVFACHEISHALYSIQEKPDNTHTYFYSGQSAKVLTDLKDGKLNKLYQLLAYCKQAILLMTTAINLQKTMTIEQKKYLWDTPLNTRHSVRVLCDELGVNLYGKNVITACIHQESQFNPKIIGEKNTNGTTDWGLCQFNDGTYLKNGIPTPIWIGIGADFPDTQFVLDNPEKCVRVMIREYKAGHISKWSSYKTGAYLKYMV